MSLIKATNIYKTYFGDDIDTPVLHKMSFSIEAGEFVAIMGPSGSGKSTLLHILGFLDEQTKGTYHFDGKVMDDYYEDEVCNIRNEKMGFVFQAFNLLARTTVYDNVQLPLLYSKRPQKEWHDLTMDAIKSVGLEHRTDYLTSQLSGGEKQRVAIARALVNQPKIIFADEPTGNLDTKTGEKILEILNNLNVKHGHTIVLITHETLIAECAKRIINIQDGQIKSDHKVRKRQCDVKGT